MTSYKLVMPEHTNQFGFLFGGYLLQWIDETAWMGASMDFPGRRFVTIGMNHVEFRKSAHGGAMLRIEITQLHRGTTSVTYHARVFSREMGTEEDIEIFVTEITFVNVNREGHKCPITP